MKVQAGSETSKEYVVLLFLSLHRFLSLWLVPVDISFCVVRMGSAFLALDSLGLCCLLFRRSCDMDGHSFLYLLHVDVVRHNANSGHSDGQEGSRDVTFYIQVSHRNCTFYLSALT